VTEAVLREAGEGSAVAEYKRVFKEVLDNRPSGMRLRLAHAIGKNRSFVSQISNPAYPVPIPVQHLKTIFEVCHFPPPTKAAFLHAYARAHPRRVGQLDEIPSARTIKLEDPPTPFKTSRILETSLSLTEIGMAPRTGERTTVAYTMFGSRTSML